ncbi:hypothetical protein BC937DRAFT_88931 [Endogone sp. FLAS-F59071]|nr:hypothetical protein BC937DRAFT_88931 [Endogone sp. FLAS-F59071]|eukprot:RUS18316.1 hypothetical protein BC937DRAFT_88931 [Endogone sp. FLAS-F59071]
MARPTFLTLPVLFALLAHAAAYTPLPQWGQTALLLNNTIYVYGGETLTAVGLTSFFTLDVSIPWNISGPTWADHTSDAGTVTVPQVAFGTMFRAYDNQSFYIWGGGSTPNTTLLENGFAQYNFATKQWSLPSSIANMPMQRRSLNAVTSSSGVAYIWGGIGDSFTDVNPTIR